MDESNALSTHRFLLKFAFAGVLFSWIAGFAMVSIISQNPIVGFVVTLTVYAFSHVVIFFGAPLCAPHVRDGLRRLLVLGTLMLSIGLAYEGVIFASEQTVQTTLWTMVLFGFIWGLYRALYAIPYRVHSETVRIPRNVVAEIALALAPLGFAFLVEMGGFAWGCGIASFCALLALFPLARVSETYESYTWTLGESVGNIFMPQNRSLVMHALALGAERAVLFLVWPLIIFMIAGSFLGFGILMSVTLVLTLMLKGSVRKFFSQFGVHRSSFASSISVVSVWIVRGMVASPLGVLVAHVSSALLPHTTHEAPDPVYLDEYSVLSEMASALGAILICVIGIVLAFFVSLALVLFWVCIIAGFLSAYAMRIEKHVEPRV